MAITKVIVMLRKKERERERKGEREREREIVGKEASLTEFTVTMMTVIVVVVEWSKLIPRELKRKKSRLRKRKSNEKSLTKN